MNAVKSDQDPDPAADKSAFSITAVFSYGFRPFFLFGSLYAAVLIMIWVPWFLGLLSLPTDFPPVSWHAHELLFGYVGAAMAGFLLTAVPNWTGRKPITGWFLVALFTLWIAGRLAVAVSSTIGFSLASAVALAFPICLVGAIAFEIFAARNWRNLKILLLLFGFLAAQALFNWEIWRFGRTVIADRLATAAALTLIIVIAGRIIPIFTGNWLRTRGISKTPSAFSSFDTVAVGIGVVALCLWVLEPYERLPGEVAGVFLLIAAALHLWRQSRWQPHLTMSEPLVAILHAAYLFVPIGFVFAGGAAFTGNFGVAAAATHAWTAGAIATMTLGIMTRASLGHTGHALTASTITQAIYVSVLSAATLRIVVSVFPQWTMVLMPLAGLTWVFAFLGFAFAYGSMLLKPRT